MARGRKKTETYPNNDKKQLCEKCMYKTTLSVFKSGTRDVKPSIGCDYIGITGRARILRCYDPIHCTVYKMGKQARRLPEYRVKVE